MVKSQLMLPPLIVLFNVSENSVGAPFGGKGRHGGDGGDGGVGGGDGGVGGEGGGKGGTCAAGAGCRVGGGDTCLDGCQVQAGHAEMRTAITSGAHRGRAGAGGRTPKRQPP